MSDDDIPFADDELEYNVPYTGNEDTYMNNKNKNAKNNNANNKNANDKNKIGNKNKDENGNGNENENENEDENENILNVDESLLEYYSLKNAYIKTHYDKYVQPIVLSNYSKITKRNKFQELDKPLCINCKQPVGTIFERKYYLNYNDKPDVIVFTAKCGNILNPCDLNIEIQKSAREKYDVLIKSEEEYINELHLKIIKLKNKILYLGKKTFSSINKPIDKPIDNPIETVSVFKPIKLINSYKKKTTNDEKTNNEEQKGGGYIEEFEKYKEEILYHSKKLGEFIEENILLNDNPEEQQKLNNMIASLNQNEIIEFQNNIRKYADTNDDNFLSKAMNMYTSEIIPKVEQIRQLKYKTMYVKHDFEGTFTLVQSKYTPERIVFYDEDVDEVVSFVKGIKVQDLKKKQVSIPKTKEQKSKTKSRTLKTGKNLSRAKTRKRTLKITDENIVQEDEVEPDENYEEAIILTSEKPLTSKKSLISDEIPQEENVDEKDDYEEIVINTKSKNKTNAKSLEAKSLEAKSLEAKSLGSKSLEAPSDEEEIIFIPSNRVERKKPKKIGKKINLNPSTEALEI